MIITKFSPKQSEILKFAYSDEETLICDGAVRSGKTVVMTLGFILWAMSRFNKTNFAICGKTVSSAERNIIKPFQQLDGLPFDTSYKISERKLTVKCGNKENYFYIFGGRDESSYALIQGLTLAGVLFDEVALMPQSFVDQAIARTLSYKNAKLWFNCNPESPNHWFYKDFIMSKEKKFKHLHFLMNDNPILGAEEIKRAESLFTGVFYQRYILGMWVRAEGIIFSDFANDPTPHIIKAEDVPKNFRRCEVGFDIGGQGSHHAIVATAQGYDDVYYVLGVKDVIPKDLNMADIENMVEKYCSYIEEKYKIRIDLINSDWVDVVINSINDHTKYRCFKTYKPPLEDRPFAISKMLAKQTLKFVDGECDELIEQLRNAVFDEKKDKPVICDDGTMCIDCIDGFVYSISGQWHYLKI